VLILDDNLNLDEISCQTTQEYLSNIFGEFNYFIYENDFSPELGIMMGNVNNFNCTKFIQLGFFNIEKQLFCMSSQLKISQNILELKMNNNSSIPYKCTCSIDLLMREGCKCGKRSSISHQNSVSLHNLVENKRKKIIENKFKLKYIILGKKEFTDYKTSNFFHNPLSSIQNNVFYFFEAKILKSDKDSFLDFVITT